MGIYPQTPNFSLAMMTRTNSTEIKSNKPGERGYSPAEFLDFTLNHLDSPGESSYDMSINYLLYL